MNLLRIDAKTSALLVASQEIADFSDAVMAVLMHAVTSNATNIVCRIGRVLSIECVDDGDGVTQDELAALAERCNAPSASFSDSSPIPLAHVIAAAHAIEFTTRITNGATSVLTKSIASSSKAVCMRAAVARATHGSTLRIERCFANAPVRYEWLSSAKAFAEQIGELHARIDCFAVAHPHVSFNVLCDGDAPFARFATAYTTISERMAFAFPALTPIPIIGGRSSTAVGVTQVFAAQTLVAHVRAATQLVYLNGAPLSAEHHERLYDAIDAALTHKLAPQSRSAARLHAAFAVFFESRAQGVVVAQHCERITDCAIADSMEAALRAVLQSPPRATTSTSLHQSNTMSINKNTNKSTTLPVVVSYAPISLPSPQRRQSLSELYTKWMKPRAGVATTAAASTTTTTASTTTSDIQFSRADMGAWRFVAQVDRKYLLLWWPERQMLIAADQHAVDERINLERLEASVFGDIASVARRCHPLTKALEWHVTREQARLLGDAAARDAAHRWGFRYSWLDDHTLLVTQQPAIESTALDLDALLDIAACATQPGSSRPQTVERILHAKACRSAIMFGDELSGDECAALLAAWRTTERPFVCAHGRPSVVPMQGFIYKSAPKLFSPE